MDDLKFEFISYTPVLNDQYMVGIITIKLYGKIELRYKNISKKDGSGTFFAPASYSVNSNNGKEYISSFKLSEEDNAIVSTLIRNNINKPKKDYVQSEIEMPSKNNYNDNLPF